MASEEIVEGRALEKETDARGQTSSHKGTRSELLRSHTPASNSPSAVPRLEVTLHKLQRPQPHCYRLTITDTPASRPATSNRSSSAKRMDLFLKLLTSPFVALQIS